MNKHARLKAMNAQSGGGNCKKHNLPLIWYKIEGKTLYKLCTNCLDEAWEQEFKDIRSYWRELSKDEILIELKLFYKWMIDKRYSESYAKRASYTVKQILREFRKRKIELNEDNIKRFVKDRTRQVKRNYINAYRRFIEFKRGLEGISK